MREAPRDLEEERPRERKRRRKGRRARWVHHHAHDILGDSGSFELYQVGRRQLHRFLAFCKLLMIRASGKPAFTDAITSSTGEAAGLPYRRLGGSRGRRPGHSTPGPSGRI